LNDATPIAIAIAIAIDHALLTRARALRDISKRTLVEELETLSGLEPRLVVRALALPFGLAVLETADMLAFAPAFDLLPLAQALARRSVLLRAGDGQVLGVVADPFDLDLQTWLGARARRPAREPLQIRLALQSDIQAYLSKQEESARAVDNLPGAVAAGRRRPPRRQDGGRAVFRLGVGSRQSRPSSWSTRPCTTPSKRAPPTFIWRVRPAAWPSSTASTACSITLPR